MQNRKIKKYTVPDVHKLAREMTSKSQIMIIIGRALRLSPITLFKMGLNNIFIAPMVLKKDFAAGIKILCELEILRDKKNHHILHNQFVDMAVANNNKKVLAFFFSMAKKYSFKPGIITYNIGPLIKHLSHLRNVPDNLVIYTPIDKKGFAMNPEYEDVIEYIENSHLDIQPL